MRRLRWLGLAALLLAAAALLLALGEKDAAPTRRAAVHYPEWYSTEQWQRRKVRETLALPARPSAAPAPAPGAEPGEGPHLRDPFLVALPVKPGAPVMIFEANALRHSVLGEKFLACLDAHKPGELDEVQRRTGVDPRKDIDRIGFTEDAVVISGFFRDLHLDDLVAAPPEAYGDAGRIYSEGGRRWLATWRDGIVVLAASRQGLERSIDQLEGRAPVPVTGIAEDQAYGEVYGVVPGAAARKLMGLDPRGIGERLAQLADRIELHVDAMQDVAAVVHVRGRDAQGLSDLARSMGAALAVARVEAQAEGSAKVAELLESAEVRRPEDGQISLRFAVTTAQLERWFAGCGREAPGESSATPGR